MPVLVVVVVVVAVAVAVVLDEEVAVVVELSPPEPPVPPELEVVSAPNNCGLTLSPHDAATSAAATQSVTGPGHRRVVRASIGYWALISASTSEAMVCSSPDSYPA